ncbi:APO protein 4, mitochondrial-like [Euphorbia lathyris]|uniref:APO protein 4, mitochondrial-like n=1 Tax=Euphorbia lathyris TaxID=212925 RepID=UPI0033142C87
MSKNMWLNFARDYRGYCMHFRFYSSGTDWKKLKLMIMDRIDNGHKKRFVEDMVPIAKEVLKVRMFLIQGVSTLLQAIPTVSCKFCSEVYIGEEGHLIRTCGRFMDPRAPKDQYHQWVPASLNDILVPVETIHLNNKSNKVIEHDQRCDFDHFPAVVELCKMAVDFSMEILYPDIKSLDGVLCVNNETKLSPEDLNFVASGTLTAWEALRLGVKKLLLVCPGKVCKYCSEINVWPFRNRLHLHCIFKQESLCGSHFWQSAVVNDLVPQKIVWHQRPHDPPVLLDKGRAFYGHAPAVVSLCAKAGAIVPPKYYRMMKLRGLQPPV